MKITEEQKQQLINLNDSKVNEILCIPQEGKWYKDGIEKNALYCVTEILEDRFYFYGFNIHGLFTTSDWYLIKNCEFKEATNEEVANALINEAKKRGLTHGNKFKDCNDILFNEGYGSYVFENNRLYYNGATLFDNGKWAEVINKQDIINQINNCRAMKTIKLSVEQAKELYNTNKEFRNTILHEFTDSELEIEPILRDWEDLDFLNTFYPMHNGQVDKQLIEAYSAYLNVPTEKHAKSMIAFAKLSMLMADLGDECNVNINEDNIKFIIRLHSGGLKDWTRYSYSFLAFKTESIRDAFYEKHEQLIKDYFMID